MIISAADLKLGWFDNCHFIDDKGGTHKGNKNSAFKSLIIQINSINCKDENLL